MSQKRILFARGVDRVGHLRVIGDMNQSGLRRAEQQSAGGLSVRWMGSEQSWIQHGNLWC